MEEVKLFRYQDKDGMEQWATNFDLFHALKEIHTDDCDLLFIHTDTAALGFPNTKLKKKEFLKAILDAILALNVKTILFPAFTFSFANGESFSVNDSTAKYMGALNEYARKYPDAVRSLDPMMSVVAIGEEAKSFYHVGKRCMGEGGIFSMLHKHPRVRFLFLGAKPTFCFTYAHYVEACYPVPYRFEKAYTGMITDREGNTYEDTYSVFAACKGVILGPMQPFEKHMMVKNAFEIKKLGAGMLTCFKEEDAYQAVLDGLDENIQGFLAQPFTNKDLVKEVKHNTEHTVMVP